MKHSKFRKLSWAEVKNREMPLHFTLLCYFLLFGLLILVVLWIFQSFFLESFYTSTKKNAAEKSAKIIAESLENNQNPLATIENVASYNSLCVQVYDTSTAFFQKRYECNYASPSVSLNIEAHKVYSYYSCASDNNGSCLEIIGENERQDGLFEDYQKNTATNDTASKFNWKRKLSGTAKIMTYGKILSLEDGTECFVIVSSVITPINNTIEIIKDQIFVISIVFFVLAVAISLYASQRIAKPISLTTKAAKELAKKNYDVEFDSKGYLEVQELNDTLNFAKKELAANERLQRELIANISHDLRTPLTNISGTAALLMDNELPENKRRQMYTSVYDDAQWLINLVENLLSITRMEGGSRIENTQPELLDDVFREAVSHADRKLGEHKLSVQLGDELLMAYMDARLIVQIIINLLNNAVKYTPPGSHICLSAAARADRVIISVSDDGNGIADDVKNKIFDMFYTSGKASSDARRGLGLGLALCKSIVEAHGGSISVLDNVPHGAVFTFDLKRAEVQSDE